MTLPVTIAVRDAILTALREAWPTALTTSEVCRAVTTDGTIGPYNRVYPGLQALTRKGHVVHTAPVGGARSAMWSLHPNLIDPEAVNRLEAMWETKFPAE